MRLFEGDIAAETKTECGRDYICLCFNCVNNLLANDLTIYTNNCCYSEDSGAAPAKLFKWNPCSVYLNTAKGFERPEGRNSLVLEK